MTTATLVALLGALVSAALLFFAYAGVHQCRVAALPGQKRELPPALRERPRTATRTHTDTFTASTLDLMVDSAASSWKTGQTLKEAFHTHELLVWECDSTGKIVLSKGDELLTRLGLPPGSSIVGQNLFTDWSKDTGTIRLVRACLADGQAHDWTGEGPYTPGVCWFVRCVPITRDGRRFVRAIAHTVDLPKEAQP